MLEPSPELDRILGEASHAAGQYLCQGPSAPYADMKVAGVEGVRSRLARSPDATHQEIAGWVAVEQTFVIKESGAGLQRDYPTAPLFSAAEDALTLALDYYDERLDPIDHLLRVELAMASLAIYSNWVTDTAISRDAISTYHEETAEIGRGLLDLRHSLRGKEDRHWENRSQLNGLAGELVTLLAFNRRYRDETVVPTVALPSTLRQNLSRRPGSVGKKYDTSYLRGNWDVSVIEGTTLAGKPEGDASGTAWRLHDKLQIKNVLSVFNPAQAEAQQPGYTDDITVVGVHEHICSTLPGINTWEALKILTGQDTSCSRSRQKRAATAMTRELVAHIDRDRERRHALMNPQVHTYIPRGQRNPLSSAQLAGEAI